MSTSTAPDPRSAEPSAPARGIALLYGVLCYVIGFGGLAYAMAFLNDVLVPKTLNGEVAATGATAVLINVALVLLFGLQHSIMPRPWFKRALTRVLPAWAERSAYVCLSGVALIVLYVFWQPMPEVIWRAESPALRWALYGVQVLGWGVLVLATFMLNHFELFGLSQVWAFVRGRPRAASHFRTPGFYRRIRHPIQLGVMIAFLATPDLTHGHALFAGAFSIYILLALRCLEEPALRREFPEQYTTYQAQVPMLFPRPGRKVSAPTQSA